MVTFVLWKSVNEDVLFARLRGYWLIWVSGKGVTAVFP
jgi:hypothetical protein